MADDAFTYIEPGLDFVFQELCRREPIFHTPEFGATLSDFEQVMSSEYWEVGASGRCYSREFIRHAFSHNLPVNAAAEGWQTDQHGLRRLGAETYLFTYRLRQGDRLTRRSTIWKGTPEAWQILYHQGTVITE